MLDLLYQFGRQLSLNADREEFDDLISIPSIDEKDVAKGIQFHVVNMIFDLNNGTFLPNSKTKTLSLEDKGFSHSPYNLRCLKIQGGNNKSIYPTVDPRKSFDPWKKTLFGKTSNDGSPPKEAELVEAIQKDFPSLMERQFCKAVGLIFIMRKDFEAAFPDVKALSSVFGMDERNKIAMLYASVVSTELGIPNPTPVVQLDGFDDFLRQKMQKGGSQKFTKEIVANSLKCCYVTGELREDVDRPEFSDRYSLNKMFVTTTKNYAVGFEDGGFAKNYQASAKAQVFLERGSAHLLKHYKVQIAGVDHCILPHVRAGKDIDLNVLTTRLKARSELLFLMHKKQVGGLIEDMESLAGEDMYWINFLGFESDGNFFKSINRIEDVSKTHLEQIIKIMSVVEIEMSEIDGIQWNKVMTYGKEQIPYDFNFQTIYSLIPIRKEKTKRNDALMLFKAILERRSISKEVIMGHFVDLIQCHRFGRYSGSNIFENSNFDFAVRDAVFQYHAFIQFLKKIKLLDMAETLGTSAATLEEKNAAFTAFFERMDFTDDHRAVFFLGVILNNVGYAQAQKKHESKPVLGKINYNGMNASALKRLRNELFEKCRQYDILRYNEGNFAKFTDLFKDSDNDHWDKRIKPETALFYLLSGYSFRTPKENVDKTETDH